MIEQETEDMPRAVVRLLKEDHEVQATVLNLVLSCPNVVMKF